MYKYNRFSNCIKLFTDYSLFHKVYQCIVLFFSYKPILDYVNNQFNTYLKDESGLNRRNIVDNRIHCCFYFISPTG